MVAETVEVTFSDDVVAVVGLSSLLGQRGDDYHDSFIEAIHFSMLTKIIGAIYSAVKLIHQNKFIFL